MHGILRPRQAPPAALDPAIDSEAAARLFLAQARNSALARFGRHRLFGGCFTTECAVSGHVRRGGCAGSIIVHWSPDLCKAWAKAVPLPAHERRAHVMQQIGLVLQDLSDHDAHSCLPLAASQRHAYQQDLSQLIRESLDRTTFALLRRMAQPHWEGSFVRSLRPPFLVLVASVRL